MPRHFDNSNKKRRAVRKPSTIKPAARAHGKRSEDQELVAFFDWVRWNESGDSLFSLIFHIANERKTSPRAGAYLKRKGVRAGIPDVCVPVARHGYSAMYVELKIKPNKISDAQKERMLALHGAGNCVRVAWSAQELINLVKWYLFED